MKCPILAIAWSGVVAKQQEEYPDCIQSVCARWDDAVNCCIDITIGDALEGIMLSLNRIEEKMPHKR